MKREEKYIAWIMVVVLLVVGFWQEYVQKRENVQAVEQQVGSPEENSLNSVSTETSEMDRERKIEPDLNQMVLVGDSRTQGLQLAADVTEADFLAERGFSVDQMTEEAIFTLQDGSYGTAMDVIAEKSYDQVILMFGLNELGWAYEDIFIEEYREVVREIKTVQPEIQIYIHGILPVTAERANEGDEFNNERIQARNVLLAQLAAEEGCGYIEPADVLCDETGALMAQASTDGIHITAEYCRLWMDDIIKQMVV